MSHYHPIVGTALTCFWRTLRLMRDHAAQTGELGEPKLYDALSKLLNHINASISGRYGTDYNVGEFFYELNEALALMVSRNMCSSEQAQAIIEELVLDESFSECDDDADYFIKNHHDLVTFTVSSGERNHYGDMPLMHRVISSLNVEHYESTDYLSANEEFLVELDHLRGSLMLFSSVPYWNHKMNRVFGGAVLELIDHGELELGEALATFDRLSIWDFFVDQVLKRLTGDEDDVRERKMGYLFAVLTHMVVTTKDGVVPGIDVEDMVGVLNNDLSALPVPLALKLVTIPGSAIMVGGAPHQSVVILKGLHLVSDGR